MMSFTATVTSLQGVLRLPVIRWHSPSIHCPLPRRFFLSFLSNITSPSSCTSDHFPSLLAVVPFNLLLQQNSPTRSGSLQLLCPVNSTNALLSSPSTVTSRLRNPLASPQFPKVACDGAAPSSPWCGLGDTCSPGPGHLHSSLLIPCLFSVGGGVSLNLRAPSLELFSSPSMCLP